MMIMAFLNYHHLRYFRAIAQMGSVSKAALALNISQSALSIQLRQLESQLGQSLFDRTGRSLVLTEAGRLVLGYANTIFQTGDELLETLRGNTSRRRRYLRIGAVATLSRNFQFSFLRPLLVRTDLELVLRSGTQHDLLVQLKTHALDLVLSNLAVRRDSDNLWHSHLLDEQPVSLVGHPRPRQKPFHFPDDLRKVSLLLPSLDSNIRVAFDLLMDRHRIRPVIAAEVDDMAMLRLLATDSRSLALVPPVVVQDELERGLLTELHQFEEIRENFYAISPSRRFPNPEVAALIEAWHAKRRPRKPAGRAAGCSATSRK